MTASENVAFISRQLSTFQAMRKDSDRVVAAARARVSSVREEAVETRRRIRALKDSLIAADRTPSVADITRLVETRDRLNTLSTRQRELEVLKDELVSLHGHWRTNRQALRAVSANDLSASDRRKLSLVQDSLRKQLRRYQFGSLSPDAVEVNSDTYRPAHEGFDLGFDLSASDMIRVIWAYLIALLQVSDSEDGNHPGFLILDEPRQQETARASYEQLLHQAAEEAQRGAQIVFATSEPLDDLISMLGGRDVDLVALPSGTKLIS